MGNVVGRTGFHVTHEKSVKKRGAILDEMMRELKDESIERWAQRNPSIVVEDEGLNRAYVNNGDGRLVRARTRRKSLLTDSSGSLNCPLRLRNRSSIR